MSVIAGHDIPPFIKGNKYGTNNSGVIILALGPAQKPYRIGLLFTHKILISGRFL